MDSSLGRIVGRWMGHAPQGIREKHYEGRLTKLMAEHITPKLDDICTKYGLEMHFSALTDQSYEKA